MIRAPCRHCSWTLRHLLEDSNMSLFQALTAVAIVTIGFTSAAAQTVAWG